jgi:hypothetical protein
MNRRAWIRGTCKRHIHRDLKSKISNQECAGLPDMQPPVDWKTLKSFRCVLLAKKFFSCTVDRPDYEGSTVVVVVVVARQVQLSATFCGLSIFSRSSGSCLRVRPRLAQVGRFIRHRCSPCYSSCRSMRSWPISPSRLTTSSRHLCVILPMRADRPNSVKRPFSATPST